MFLKILFLFSISLPVLASEFIAINIALRPSTSLEKMLKNWNAKTNKEIGFIFDDTHLPHLTLIQAIIKKADLPQVRRIVKEVKFKNMALRPSNFELEQIEGNSSVKLLNIGFEKKKELDVLQDEVVSKVKGMIVKHDLPDAFFDPKTMKFQFVKYANNYVEEKTGSNFKPHITLGVVSKSYKPDDISSIPGVFNSVQIYQIGEFGSARKSLFE